MSDKMRLEEVAPPKTGAWAGLQALVKSVVKLTEAVNELIRRENERSDRER